MSFLDWHHYFHDVTGIFTKAISSYLFIGKQRQQHKAYQTSIQFVQEIHFQI